MTLEQFIAAWPVILWASTMIFLAGGVWFTLIRMGKDLRDMKPLLEKIAPLEVRVESHAGELERIRADLQNVDQKAQNALLAAAHLGD